MISVLIPSQSYGNCYSMKLDLEIKWTKTNSIRDKIIHLVEGHMKGEDSISGPGTTGWIFPERKNAVS